MKYLHDYRQSEPVRRLVGALETLVRKPMNIMEICGGQTHSIVKYGIDRLIPDTLRLVHGPGCPVCVTPEDRIDAAIQIARQPEVIFCSYGDMLRVPGKNGSLLQAKAEGAEIRVLYSPQELLTLAQQFPNKQIVFFAIGFETTAPAHAMVLHAARKRQLTNISFLVAHVLVPPAMRAILAQQACDIQGFLAAGHVCAVTGYRAYHELAERYHVPIVVTGFEPFDILHGLLLCVELFQSGRASVANQYSRAVCEDGNVHARAIVNEVFDICDARWRGIGIIPQSGLALSKRYQEFDAQLRFNIVGSLPESESLCHAGQVLLGRLKPKDCPQFGKLCTPEHPLGAPMVSGEGACAAYFTLRDHPFKESR